MGLVNRCNLNGQGFECRLGRDHFFFSVPVQTSPWSHRTSCIICSGLFPGVKRPGLSVDNPPYLAPRLRMSGAIPLLPLRVFMTFYGVTFAFTVKEIVLYRV